MRKVIHFCKTYHTEMLLAVLDVLCIIAIIFCLSNFRGLIAGGIITSTVILQAIVGYHIQKLDSKFPQPSLSFTIVWYAGFIASAITLIIGTVILNVSEQLSFYILLEAEFTILVAMFGQLVAVAALPPEKIAYSTVLANSDNDD